MARMTDDELMRVVTSEVDVAVGREGDDVSEARASALERYEGEPYGDEREGRSKVMDRSVFETVEWLMPSLMRSFTGSDDIVVFEPEGPEDEEAAKQATDYVHFVVRRDNPGFVNFMDWFKDALITKNGVVKFWWEDYERTKEYTLENLSDDEFVAIVSDESVEVIEHSERPSEGTETIETLPMPGMARPMVHDIKYRTTTKGGRACWRPIPPEDLMVSRRSSTLEEARSVTDRRRYTRAELEEEGYGKELLDRLSFSDYSDDDSLLAEARWRYENTYGIVGNSGMDPEEVWVYETYIKIDYENKGRVNRWKVRWAGDIGTATLLPDPETGESAIQFDHLPYADICPIRLPHRWAGISLADTVMEIQRIKTVLLRQMLDSLYLANNPRFELVDQMVNLDDFLNSTIGGAVRVKQPGSINALNTEFVGGQSFPMLQYVDQAREYRSGVGLQSAGMSPEALQNETAEGVRDARSAIEARVELIARIFAETGVRDLFRGILKLLKKHQPKERLIKLRNEWVPMDPRGWNDEMDVTVKVGLGNAAKEKLIGRYVGLAAQQKEVLMTLGPTNPLVGLQEFYNTQAELVRAAELGDVERFWKDPARQPPQPPQEPPPDPKMIEAQAKIQLEQMKAQADAELERQKAEIDVQLQQQKAAADLQSKREQAQMDMQVEREKAAMANELAREKAALELRLKEEQFQFEAALAERKAQLEAQTAAMKTAVQLGGEVG